MPAGAVAAMAAIECCYFLDDGSPAKRAAGLAWIAVSVAMFAVAAAVAARPFLLRSFWGSPGRWWYVLAAVLPLALVYFGVNGTTWTPLNPEGTAQAVIGRDLLRHDPSFGVFKAAYFGRYVARQYALSSLPTLAFGPSFAALRVGNSLGYVLSYLVFLSALWAYLAPRTRSALLWSSWTGVMVSLGQYPIIQARMFEQTVMPLGATMMFLAALLHYLARPSPAKAAWVAWSVGFLASGYTPAYATWVLAMGILAYLALDPRRGHRVLMLALAQGLVALAVAGLILRDGGQLHSIVRAGPAGPAVSDWLWRYFEGFTAEFNAGNSVIPVPLGVAAVMVLWLSLRHREWRVPVVFIWCIAVVVAGLSMQGSFFDSPHYDAHRSMIILPVIATAATLFYLRYYAGGEAGAMIERIAAYCIVYMAFTSASVPLLNRWYYYNGDMTDMDEAGAKISEVAHDPRKPPIEELCVIPPLKLNKFEVENGLEYFFPGARAIQGAAPVKRAGCYVLEYNDTPRPAGYRSGFRASIRYLSLHEAGVSERMGRVLEEIKGNGGLVADYRFADGAGSAAADSEGHFGPAVLSLGAGWAEADGRPAVLLGGNEGFVRLPSMGIEARGLTLAVRVRWSGGAGEQGILKVGAEGATHLYLCERGGAGVLRLLVETPIPPKFKQMVVIDAPAPPVGAWSQLAVELTGEEAILFVDGEPAGRNRVRLERIDVLRCADNWVGRPLSDGTGFNGLVGGLRIYDRALGGDELRRLAHDPAPR